MSLPLNWRIAGGVAAVAVYAVLSHLLMAHWPDRPWSVAVLFGPLIAGMALAGLVRRHWPTLAGCALLALLVVLTVRAGGVGMNRLYVLQHAAIHAVLAATFGLTLRPGATPLITLLAERVHTRFEPAQRAYTRAVTVLWTGYFIAMIFISLAIYALAPWDDWSLFCNLVTPLAAVSLFIGEYVVRYRRHPDFEHVSLLQAVRAYRAVMSDK